MKTPQSRTGSSFAKTMLGLAAALFLTTISAHATLLFSGVDLKSAGRTSQWALFSLSGGITITDTTNQAPIPAVSAQNGNAIIGASGGSITLSGTTKVVGTAYIRNPGVLRKSGTATIVGPGLQPQNPANDTFTNQVQLDALAAASQANALANNTTGVTDSGWAVPGVFNTVNQNTSLSLSTGATDRHVVLHLTDFVLTGSASFTLTGTAQTTYVINVANNFTLLGGQILLAGGLQPENVMFNITGAGTDASMTSMAQFNGILYATQRTVNVSGISQVNGMIMAGKVNISGGSRIYKPTFISP